MYNDNIHLSTVSQNDVWGTTIEPALKLEALEENRELKFEGKLRSTRYSGEEGLDTDDIFVNINGMHQTERSRWEFTGDYTIDSTLDRDLTESGIVSQRVERTSKSLNPSWSYSLTEKMFVTLGYQFNDVRYSAVQNSVFIGSRTHNVSATLANQLTEKSQISGMVSHMNYESHDGIRKTTVTSAFGGINHKFSETHTASVSFGLRDLTSINEAHTGVILLNPFTGEPIFGPIPRTEFSSSGYVFTAGFEKQFEAGSLSATASRSVSPVATGGVNEQDSFSITYERNLTPLLTASLVADGYVTNSEDTGATYTDRSRFRVRPSLRWEINRRWALRATYSYTKQEFEAGSDSADSNAVFVNLTHTWPRMSASR